MKASDIAVTLLCLMILAFAGCSRARERQPGSAGALPPAAEAFVNLLVKEDFSGAVGQFDRTMKVVLPEEKLRETWRLVTGQTGPFQEILGTRTMQQSGYDIVFVTCEFEQAVLDVKVVFDADGRVSGLFFVPGERPSPDDAVSVTAPTNIVETAVEVGEGQWALPGTLSRPAGRSGPWPAVVLVHGSGPNDRDETVGSTKPFRDLAWGLAAQGVAVLRYEKVTKAYPGRFRGRQGFTVKEETIDDALAAVGRLRTTEGIDTNRILVLGHSLGGMLAPRIAQADSALAGLIIMAGATRPMEDLVVEQTRYLLSLDGELSPEDHARLAKLEAEVAKVKTASDPSSTTLVLGAPASYWVDLRRYDAPAVAKTLPQPLLILQGGRDYQVTEADFEVWQSALKGRKNVTFKLYPKLNHLFMAGEGQSTPSEYERPKRVAAEVIADIAEWISHR